MNNAKHLSLVPNDPSTPVESPSLTKAEVFSLHHKFESMIRTAKHLNLTSEVRELKKKQRDVNKAYGGEITAHDIENTKVNSLKKLLTSKYNINFTTYEHSSEFDFNLEVIELVSVKSNLKILSFHGINPFKTEFISCLMLIPKNTDNSEEFELVEYFEEATDYGKIDIGLDNQDLNEIESFLQDVKPEVIIEAPPVVKEVMKEYDSVIDCADLFKSKMKQNEQMARITETKESKSSTVVKVKAPKVEVSMSQPVREEETPSVSRWDKIKNLSFEATIVLLMTMMVMSFIK